MLTIETTTAFDSAAARANYIGRLENYPELINLGGNYDYLGRAYYASLDLEHSERQVRPGCRQMLDAYVPPLFLEKARLANLSVPESYISNGYFEPPVIVDPVNPFTLRGRVVLKPGRAKSIARSLTRNFTYAVCCQDIPPGARVFRFRAVLGWCYSPRWLEAAESVWRVFGIPLATVRVLRLVDGKVLLSDIAPLLIPDLTIPERRYLEERVTWGS